MRMPCPRILVSLLTAVVILGIAHAEAADPSPAANAAWHDERYVILPGSEDLFAEMLGKGETLAGGCKLTDGKIERSSVLATYACGAGDVGIELDHPASPSAGAVRTDRFAIAVKSGTPPGDLVESVASHVRAHEGKFEWKDLGPRGGPGNRMWLGAVALGVLAAILSFWALRRRRTEVG
jgi:hypothetical protein